MAFVKTPAEDEQNNTLGSSTSTLPSSDIGTGSASSQSAVPSAPQVKAPTPEVNSANRALSLNQDQGVNLAGTLSNKIADTGANQINTADQNVQTSELGNVNPAVKDLATNQGYIDTTFGNAKSASADDVSKFQDLYKNTGTWTGPTGVSTTGQAQLDANKQNAVDSANTLVGAGKGNLLQDYYTSQNRAPTAGVRAFDQGLLTVAPGAQDILNQGAAKVGTAGNTATKNVQNAVNGAIADAQTKNKQTNDYINQKYGTSRNAVLSNVDKETQAANTAAQAQTAALKSKVASGGKLTPDELAQLNISQADYDKYLATQVNPYPNGIAPTNTVSVGSPPQLSDYQPSGQYGDNSEAAYRNAQQNYQNALNAYNANTAAANTGNVTTTPTTGTYEPLPLNPSNNFVADNATPINQQTVATPDEYATLAAYNKLLGKTEPTFTDANMSGKYTPDQVNFDVNGYLADAAKTQDAGVAGDKALTQAGLAPASRAIVQPKLTGLTNARQAIVDAAAAAKKADPSGFDSKSYQDQYFAITDQIKALGDLITQYGNDPTALNNAVNKTKIPTPVNPNSPSAA